ncbi:hypothetical protein ACROYT_G014572 [Oculina patagonica]
MVIQQMQQGVYCMLLPLKTKLKGGGENLKTGWRGSLKGNWDGDYKTVLQKELDVFRNSVWNYHRVRKQRGEELSTGVPEHIYQCLDKYGGERATTHGSCKLIKCP